MADFKHEVESTRSHAAAMLMEVIKGVEMRNKAKLENVGEQTLFLASYPLGSKAGSKAYERALFKRKELKGNVVDGRTVCVQTYLHVLV